MGTFKWLMKKITKVFGHSTNALYYTSLYREILKEINKEVEFMGVKILTQYALLGQYDFVNIIDAPNNEAVAKLAIRLSAKGTTQTLTLAAISVDDLITTLKERESPW